MQSFPLLSPTPTLFFSCLWPTTTSLLLGAGRDQGDPNEPDWDDLDDEEEDYGRETEREEFGEKTWWVEDKEEFESYKKMVARMEIEEARSGPIGCLVQDYIKRTYRWLQGTYLVCCVKPMDVALE